jgi:hypothetical protein
MEHFLETHSGELMILITFALLVLTLIVLVPQLLRQDAVAVSLAVWCVSGVVSLAAITGGVALMGRLAQLESGDKEEVPPENPLVD